MDNDQGLGQSADVSSAPSANNLPVSTPAVTENAPNERVFRQSEVNDIVKRRVEEFKKTMTQQPEYVQQRYGEQAVQKSEAANQPSNISEAEIRRLAAEETQRLRNEWYQEAQTHSEAQQAQKIVNNFWEKIAPGKEKYQDFDQVTDIEYARFPNVVQILAETVDNAHDVLYELGKDRIKMAQLELLSQMSPGDAVVHAKKLAESIKENEQASKIRTPNQPLSQLRPSNVSTDSGVMSVSDYRRRYKI